jgi:trk system potassium uptake protein TrkA
MRIVVLGAGTVGSWIADLLCQNRHRVTVVDDDPEHVRRINKELDVRGVLGSAAQSSVLFQADVIGADICLAVTGVDEVNIVSASMAKAMGARRTVARVYSPVFRDLSTFDYQRHFGIDRLMSLEHLSAVELARHIRNPGSVLIENFARGEIEVQEVSIAPGSIVLGKPLKELKLPPRVRIGSIYRNGRNFVATANDKLEEDDRITLIGRHDDVADVRSQFSKGHRNRFSLMIAGGGETGYHLSRIMEGEPCTTTLLESNRERSAVLANQLKSTTVIEADATRRDVLEEERVGQLDIFVACTGDDENNIMSCVEARDLGAKKIMAVISRPDYAKVVGKLGIDVTISPRDVMARQIMSFLNTGVIVSRTRLPGGNTGVFEMEILEGAPITQGKLADIKTPAQCLIAALMRHGSARVPTAEDQLKAGDMVVAFIEDNVVDETVDLFTPP